MRQFNSIAIEQQGVTLVELLIALCIFALIVIGFSSIDTFSRYHVVSSDKRAKLQNDASYVLGHMAKEIGKAIGNESINGAGSVITITDNPNDDSIQIYIDASGNGKREEPKNNPLATEDHWIAYRYDATAGDQNQIRYCARCRNDSCNFNQCLDSVEILSRKIASFTPTFSSANNYVDIQINACWDADGSPAACGGLDNPALVMKNRIYMPAVSTH